MTRLSGILANSNYALWPSSHMDDRRRTLAYGTIIPSWQVAVDSQDIAALDREPVVLDQRGGFSVVEHGRAV